MPSDSIRPSEAGEPDGGTELLCGKYRLDRSRAHPLLAGLPEIVHVPARLEQDTPLRGAIELLRGELDGNRPGREAVVRGLLDLLLVYLVRAWLDEHPGAGWPGALRDTAVAAALEALHTDPGASWQAEDLAAAAGLSRATFMRRFSAYTGQSPIAYLTWWRMVSAARLLRDTELALPAIAQRVGYRSPYAFAHAFKRHSGIAPGRYRAELTDGSGHHNADA